MLRTTAAAVLLVLAAAAARADDRVLALLKGEPTGTAKTPALPTPGKEDAATLGSGTTAALAFLAQKPSEFPYRLEDSKKKFDGYTKHSVRFLSAVHTTDESDVVTGNYYQPTTKPGERLPAVVVVHHLGGGMDAEEFMAGYLAENKIAAMTIALSGYGERRAPGQKRAGFLGTVNPVEALDGMRQSILDVVRAADVLRTRPEVDSERVGAVGVSLGSIVSADAAGLDTRFSRTVLVIGGGDLQQLLSKQVPGQIGKILKESGATQELLRGAFEPVDPVSFAPRLRSEDILMLNAERDEIFPRESTLALWRKAGYPKIKWFDSTHAGIVQFMPDLMEASIEHLKAKPPARQPD
jgi:dienelactone hydrolase